MKFYWLVLGIVVVTIVGCRNSFYQPAGPYTITETYRECKDDKCKTVTNILDEKHREPQTKTIAQK